MSSKAGGGGGGQDDGGVNPASHTIAKVPLLDIAEQLFYMWGELFQREYL